MQNAVAAGPAVTNGFGKPAHGFSDKPGGFLVITAVFGLSDRLLASYVKGVRPPGEGKGLANA